MKVLALCVSSVLLGGFAAMALEVGSPAPEFSGTATGNETIRLSELRGQWVVLYFYPKADTPGCTAQSCSLRDGYTELQERGAKVIGVSLDSLDRQESFKESHNLPFPLIADTDKKIARAYDVLAPLALFTQRKTFIIDPDGNLAHIFDRVDVRSHDEEVLRELTRLQAEQSDLPE